MVNILYSPKSIALDGQELFIEFVESTDGLLLKISNKKTGIFAYCTPPLPPNVNDPSLIADYITKDQIKAMDSSGYGMAVPGPYVDGTPKRGRIPMHGVPRCPSSESTSVGLTPSPKPLRICKCDMMRLMSLGCGCGALSRERRADCTE
jgi:hypothetical protein